jgi:hypothetical protein
MSLWRRVETAKTLRPILLCRGAGYGRCGACIAVFAGIVGAPIDGRRNVSLCSRELLAPAGHPAVGLPALRSPGGFAGGTDRLRTD